MLEFRSIDRWLSLAACVQRLKYDPTRIAHLERETGRSGPQMVKYARKLIRLRSQRQMMAAVGERAAIRGVLRLGIADTIVHLAAKRAGLRTAAIAQRRSEHGPLAPTASSLASPGTLALERVADLARPRTGVARRTV